MDLKVGGIKDQRDTIMQQFQQCNEKRERRHLQKQLAKLDKKCSESYYNIVCSDAYDRYQLYELGLLTDVEMFGEYDVEELELLPLPPSLGEEQEVVEELDFLPACT